MVGIEEAGRVYATKHLWCGSAFETPSPSNLGIGIVKIVVKSSLFTVFQKNPFAIAKWMQCKWSFHPLSSDLCSNSCSQRKSAPRRRLNVRTRHQVAIGQANIKGGQ